MVATMGGMAGNNSTGSHSFRYGMIADHIQEMDVVLADGTKVTFNNKDCRAVDGLAKIGSLEGSLYREIPKLLNEYGKEIETQYPKTWRNVAGYRLELLSKKIMDVAIALDGTTTGEHGEGLARSYFNEQLYGARLHHAFRELKTLFDPDNRLNPHKVVDPIEPWDTDWLRYHPGYKTPHNPVKTSLNFNEHGGFSGLVEMCSGLGVCRSEISGTMCPSFRVTGDELHSTHSGCCGMAGSFGYQKEHYEISMAIGEQKLFPSIREAASETVIVAAGTSCRQQIKDGTGRNALHPVVVYAQGL